MKLFNIVKIGLAAATVVVYSVGCAPKEPDVVVTPGTSKTTIVHEPGAPAPANPPVVVVQPGSNKSTDTKTDTSSTTTNPPDGSSSSNTTTNSTTTKSSTGG